MNIYNRLYQIRVPTKTTSKQKSFSVVIALIIGASMGLFAKIADYPYFIDLGFTDIADRLGIWVFTATLLSIFSPSSKLAGIKVFTFFVAVLSMYYLYTALFLGFFSVKVVIFWSVWAAVTPICAYIIWYARGSGFFSNVILALPITVLLAEGFGLRDAYLPIHTHYYLIPSLMDLYFIMIIVLLLIIPRSKVQTLTVLPISIVLSLILIKLNEFYGLWSISNQKKGAILY